ncbi:MAG TPA: ribose-phosphate pyrophosphokinase-like domain-containing protein, partial [Acidobacteriota bacterium]|nr:ribose-phosphate pyrophosphokinase-like domain-containing protein [Acidobacteriota bacterium]
MRKCLTGDVATVSNLRVFSGNANRPMAEEICRHLGITLGEANTSRFSDGEFN